MCTPSLLAKIFLFVLGVLLQPCSSVSVDNEGVSISTDLSSTEWAEGGDMICISDAQNISSPEAAAESQKTNTEKKANKKTSEKKATKVSPFNTVGSNHNVANLRQHDDRCTIYLAESSIPNAGFGVFTSVEFKQGYNIAGQYGGDMLIPITDLEPLGLLKDYTWSSDIDGRLDYESNEDNHIFISGLNAHINCHFGLNNVQHDVPKYDSAELHRGKDPGAGAFTYWHDVPMVANRDIQAGEELFTSYGNPSWFKIHMGINVPDENDFRQADHIIAKARKEMSSDQTVGESIEARAELWRSIVSSIKRPMVKALLPDKFEELEEAHRVGSARYSLGGKSSLRSQEWFDENAMCSDTMYVKTSQIPQAGRGAFTKRFTPKGSILTPTPVLQISQHQLMMIGENGLATSGMQLLTNYAYGHRDSSVFLLPYNTLANYINHDSKRANAEIRWSESSLLRKEYLELEAGELLTQRAGLLFDIVATRDIDPDEEVLISYGIEWEDAWKRHVDHWSPLEGSAEYVSAEDVMKQSNGILLTEVEQKAQPYPQGIQTACYFYDQGDVDYYEEREDFNEEEGNFTVYRTTWTEDNYDCLRHCKILSRTQENGDVFYDIEVLPQDENINEDCVFSDDEKVFVDKVPSKAIFLVENKFARDQHLPNAFRHHIGLPDDVLPSAWKRKDLNEKKVA